MPVSALTQETTARWTELGVPVALLTSVCSNGTTLCSEEALMNTFMLHLTYYVGHTMYAVVTCLGKCNLYPVSSLLSQCDSGLSGRLLNFKIMRIRKASTTLFLKIILKDRM